MNLHRSAQIFLTLLALAALPGCAGFLDLYRNDRCFVPDDRYAYAREQFIQTGSLDLVQLRMEELQWQRCERNEVLYRLQKEFEVLPEALPGAPQPPAPPADFLR